jgi:hypothetical protein
MTAIKVQWLPFGTAELCPLIFSHSYKYKKQWFLRSGSESIQKTVVKFDTLNSTMKRLIWLAE